MASTKAFARSKSIEVTVRRSYPPMRPGRFAALDRPKKARRDGPMPVSTRVGQADAVTRPELERGQMRAEPRWPT
jgi:hypothetical protein